MQRNEKKQGSRVQGLQLLRPRVGVDNFRIEGNGSYVYSPFNPNFSMAMLPKMSRKAACEDK